jgi:hypothetical protein
MAILWKPYFDQKFSGFFPVDSCQLPVVSGRNRLKIIGKNPKKFWPECCFHVPAISDVFLQDTVTFPHLSCRVPRDPVTGIFGLGGILKTLAVVSTAFIGGGKERGLNSLISKSSAGFS